MGGGLERNVHENNRLHDLLLYATVTWAKIPGSPLSPTWVGG